MSSNNDGKIYVYFLQVKLSQSLLLLLVRGITRTKHGEKLRFGGGLSYTRKLELFLSRLKVLWLDTKEFGDHSLQVGGVSTTARTVVPDRLFKGIGRWRSQLAKDGYVKDNQEALMSVSRSLEL